MAVPYSVVCRYDGDRLQLQDSAISLFALTILRNVALHRKPSADQTELLDHSTRHHLCSNSRPKAQGCELQNVSHLLATEQKTSIPLIPDLPLHRE